MTITLNRANKFNALSEELLHQLQTEFDRIRDDDTVRIVVLAANGRAFCAGHDLQQMRSQHNEQYYNQLFDQYSRMMTSIGTLLQSVIASVQGLATAAGCQLVASCDLAGGVWICSVCRIWGKFGAIL